MAYVPKGGNENHKLSSNHMGKDPFNKLNPKTIPHAILKFW